jgi:hypothetical protein
MRMGESKVADRAAVVHRARKLEYFTIAWNALEGLVAVIAGVIAGSISLVGFGIDSFVEVTSGSVLLWRMSVDADVNRREQNETRSRVSRTERIVRIPNPVLASGQQTAFIHTRSEDKAHRQSPYPDCRAPRSSTRRLLGVRGQSCS